jgi:hypothetical protein
VKQLILGTHKYYPNASTVLQVGGAAYTVNELTQLMQEFVNAREAVEVAKAAARAKVQVERSRAPSQIAVIRAFETIVRGSFGNKADVLAEFGLALRKVHAPIDAKQKAVAVVKRAATRAARGTVGKKKKLAIKGDVKAELVVTLADGSSPSAKSPAPAASGASGATPPRVP